LTVDDGAKLDGFEVCGSGLTGRRLDVGNCLRLVLFLFLLFLPLPWIWLGQKSVESRWK
jgi:hypothetical protein